MYVSVVPLFFKMFVVLAVSGVEHLNNGSEAAGECAFLGRCAYCNASYCYSCKPGVFGTFCEKECNNCPPGTACERENGLCKDGCKDGSSGHYCNVSCDGRCQSCDKRNAANCVQCKNNQTCVLACPADCQGHNCNSNGSYCTKGCKPGSWGQSCEKDCLADCSIVGCNRDNGTCPEDTTKMLHQITERMKCDYALATTMWISAVLWESQNPDVSSETERPTSISAFEVVVSVLSVLLVVMVGVVIFTLFLKRKHRHRETKTVVYQSQHTTNRYQENGINPRENAWEFDNDSFEHYANAQKTGATNSTDRRTKEAVDVVTRDYSIPDGTVGRKQVADINEELDERCVSEEIKLAATIDVEDTYYNTVALRERQISVQALAEYVNQMSDEDYQEEFERLPSVLIKQCNEALREENVLKNRYRGIYPYDVTRVIISSKTSDYINANYIDGYNERRGYIASVGPTIKFMGDMSVFWRVVWQENCRTIVMLTRQVESEVIKCDQYWPDKNCAKCFGNFCITGVEEEHFDFYVKRTLKMERSIGDTKGAETRTIKQFHYLAWPDKGLPENTSSLIDLLDAVNATRAKGDGPILVHCSAGVGRTGTFIAIDILTKEGQTAGHVDIYACVRNLREQRVKMVQTMAQYKFLHHALVYSFGKRDSSKTPAFSTKL